MPQETLPLGVYAIPREGDQDDGDDVHYEAEPALAVGEEGTASYTLTVNWPNDLDNVSLLIKLPDAGTPGTPAISPAQQGQSISIQDKTCIFSHDAAHTGDTITYTLTFSIGSAGGHPVRFVLEADELDGPVSRTVGIEVS